VYFFFLVGLPALAALSHLEKVHALHREKSPRVTFNTLSKAHARLRIHKLVLLYQDFSPWNSHFLKSHFETYTCAEFRKLTQPLVWRHQLPHAILFLCLSEYMKHCVKFFWPKTLNCLATFLKPGSSASRKEPYPLSRLFPVVTSFQSSQEGNEPVD